MPSSKQATKRMRQGEERRVRNKGVRSAMRTAVKKVLQAENGEEATKLLPAAMKRVDKAAKQRVIHKNTAARLKSQVTLAARAK